MAQYNACDVFAHSSLDTSFVHEVTPTNEPLMPFGRNDETVIDFIVGANIRRHDQELEDIC